MQTKTAVLILVVAAVAIVLAGCGGGGEAPGAPDGGTVGTSGTVRVLLTDAPVADLAEVWVNIIGVELVPGDGSPIIALDSDELPGQFELLSLADDPFELGVVQAPAGAYEQVRLILAADGHYLIDADGNEHALRVPSGAQTGIKVNFPDGVFEVVEGETILLLDFLAGPSVHQAGQSGQWLMRPVIHGSALSGARPAFGSIKGTVSFEDETIPQPLNGCPPAVFVEGEDAENIGEIDPETGEFEIPSLLPGDYELKVGWLNDEGEMEDGVLLIVTDTDAVEGIQVSVEPDATLVADITVRAPAGEEAGTDLGDEGELPPDPPATE